MKGQMTTASILKNYASILRPHQWIKNLLLLFPPFFAGKIFEPSVLAAVFPSFISFSFAASCAYIMNDMRDIRSDKCHETKRNRPIACGRISIPVASLIAACLYIAAMLISASVSRKFEWYLIIYLATTFTYTFFLKDIVIVDIFFIALGFLIRVLAGGEAFNIAVSNWLFLTVFVVSLMLATGKRVGEMIALGNSAKKHRKIFLSYSQSFLEGILWFSASAALVTYALYTLEHKNGLFYTVPLAAFGLLRYIYIVKQGKGDPTEALLLDAQIVGVGMLWIVMIGFITY